MKNEKTENENESAEINSSGIFDGLIKENEDDIMCYACNAPSDVNQTRRNICNLCINAYDGYLDEESYLKNPDRLKDGEDVKKFPLCDACGKHRRKVWRDYFCVDCWDLFRTYHHHHGLSLECLGCPKIECFNMDMIDHEHQNLQ